MFIPTIVQKGATGERAYDIYSYLLKNRIIFLNGQIHNEMAVVICAQLMFLESEDPTSDVHLYINSPGGSVYDALAIYDTMNFIKCDVQTWGVGLAASCGSFLLSAGTVGKRNSLPNTRFLIHEPSGGFKGRSAHFEDHANEIIYIRNLIKDIYLKNSKLSEEEIMKLMYRETFISPKEYLEYGLIDNIVDKH